MAAVRVGDISIFPGYARWEKEDGCGEQKDAENVFKIAVARVALSLVKLFKFPRSTLPNTQSTLSRILTSIQNSSFKTYRKPNSSRKPLKRFNVLSYPELF